MSYSKAFIIFKNSGTLGFSTLVGKIFYLLLFIIIGRHLGPLDLGKFSFAMSFAAIFFLVNDLGIRILAVREVSQDRNKTGKYLGNLVLLKLFLAALAFIGVFSVINLMGYPKETVTIVTLIGLASFLIHFSTSFRWIFQAYQKLEYESLVGVIQDLGNLILGCLALILNIGILGIGYSQIIVGILIVLLSWFIVSRKFQGVKIEMDLIFWKDLLKESVPFALMLVFATVYLNADTVLLSFFKGDHSVGLYNAANRLALALRMVPAVFISAFFPIASQLSKVSKVELNIFLEKSLAFMLSLALPLSLGATLLSKKIILFFYGQKFASSYSVLQIAIWGTFCMFLSVVLGYTLISMGKQKIYTKITGLGLGVNLVINFSLIPKLAQVGSSLAILGTEFFVLVAVSYTIEKLLDFKIKALLPSILKIIAASLIMMGVLYVTKDFHVVFCAGLGVISYFAAFFSFNGIYGYTLYRVKELILARL
jgi:O-antigen/teichoic acid export membrane protein